MSHPPIFQNYSLYNNFLTFWAPMKKIQAPNKLWGTPIKTWPDKMKTHDINQVEKVFFQDSGGGQIKMRITLFGLPNFQMMILQPTQPILSWYLFHYWYFSECSTTCYRPPLIAPHSQREIFAQKKIRDCWPLCPLCLPRPLAHFGSELGAMHGGGRVVWFGSVSSVQGLSGRRKYPN